MEDIKISFLSTGKRQKNMFSKMGSDLRFYKVVCKRAGQRWFFSFRFYLMTAIKNIVKIPKYPHKHWALGLLHNYSLLPNYITVVSEHPTLWITLNSLTFSTVWVPPTF
jgi:hypothetical protein